MIVLEKMEHLNKNHIKSIENTKGDEMRLKNSDLSEKEVLGILAKENFGVRVLIDYETKQVQEEDNTCTLTNTEDILTHKYFCFCRKSKGKEYTTKMCPHCGNGILRSISDIGSDTLIAKNKIAKEKDIKNYLSEYVRELKNVTVKGFLVTPHEDFSYGIKIKRFKIVVSYENKDIEITSTVENIVEIIP